MPNLVRNQNFRHIGNKTLRQINSLDDEKRSNKKINLGINKVNSNNNKIVQKKDKNPNKKLHKKKQYNWKIFNSTTKNKLQLERLLYMRLLEGA